MNIFLSISIYSETKTALYVSQPSVSGVRAFIVQLVRSAPKHQFPRGLPQPNEEVRTTTLYRYVSIILLYYAEKKLLTYRVPTRPEKLGKIRVNLEFCQSGTVGTLNIESRSNVMEIK